MKKKPNTNGGLVYPALKHHTDKHPVGGLTLRDHYACLAMQGQIAGIDGLEIGNKKSMLEIGVACYEMADAMLAARTAR